MLSNRLAHPRYSPPFSSFSHLFLCYTPEAVKNENKCYIAKWRAWKTFKQVCTEEASSVTQNQSHYQTRHSSIQVTLLATWDQVGQGVRKEAGQVHRDQPIPHGIHSWHRGISDHPRPQPLWQGGIEHFMSTPQRDSDGLCQRHSNGRHGGVLWISPPITNSPKGSWGYP